MANVLKDEKKQQIITLGRLGWSLRKTLLPLPVEPFRYYQYGERVVHLDGCVEVEAAYDGLPPGWIDRGN